MQRRLLRKVTPLTHDFDDCISLNGSSQYLEMPSMFTSLTYTMSGWFKLSSIGNYGLMGNDGDSQPYIIMNASSDEIRMRSDSNRQFSFNPFLTGQWYHVLAANNANSSRAFINGVESSTGQLLSTGAISLDLIGTVNGFNLFDGELDDILITDIYDNPALMAENLYNDGDGRSPLNVIPTAQHLYSLDSNYNNSGTAGGVATPVGSPTFVAH